VLSAVVDNSTPCALHMCSEGDGKKKSSAQERERGESRQAGLFP